MKYYSVLFFISFFTVLICALRDQAVGVTGILKCGDNPAADVVVKLMDKDTGKQHFMTHTNKNFDHIRSRS